MSGYTLLHSLRFNYDGVRVPHASALTISWVCHGFSSLEGGADCLLQMYTASHYSLQSRCDPAVSSHLIKHWERSPSVLGGHLISINIPPRKEEGYYTYSLRVGCLLIGVKSLPLTL